MGKRAKKKVQGISPAKAGGAASRASSSSSISIPPDTSGPPESGRLLENGGSSPVGTGCPHGANVDKLRIQLAKSAEIHCLECAKLRSGVSVGKERKGKAKAVRKKPLPSPHTPLDDKNSSQKLWICLSCGHAGCGGGNSLLSNGGGEVNTKHETKPGIVGRGHAWQHWLQLKHPIVMHCGEEFSCWCFQCEVAHDHDSAAECGHQSPVEGEAEVVSTPPPSRAWLLQQSANLLREKLTEQTAEVRHESQEMNRSEDVEKSSEAIELENVVEEERESSRNKRVIKGLINLGNTCFFNSVMQNLLSVELLRNHFSLEPSGPEGALTSSLRKFFQEASAHTQPEASISSGSDTGVKKSVKARGGWSSIDGTYNPKGFFGAICSKSPRFKGYQQQDSHELLRCLLDGLHTEEESFWKASSKSKAAGGEEALRALSKAGVCDNGSQSQFGILEDSGDPLQDEEVPMIQVACEEHNKGEDAEHKAPVPTETFVQKVFGGQLSSTVSCCECGHSSVVHESFLDLSLPIPSKKASKKPVRETGSSVAIGKNQRVQALKNAKANGKDLDVFKSTPAGLGTPLLLLPQPPPKDQNVNLVDSGTGSDGGWLDYINPGTGSDDADWLDLLDEDRSAESQVVFGCYSNSESQIVSGCSPNPEPQIIFGCAPNPVLMNQLTGLSETSDGNGSPQTRLGPLADVDQFPVELKQNGDSVVADISSEAPVDQVCFVPLSDKFLLLEAAAEPYSEPDDCSRLCEAGTLGIWPIRCQEADVQVQMRGGSDIQSGSCQESELDCPIVEQVTDVSASVEQSEDCDDVTRLHSDIINGPSGTVILLGPPVDNGLAANCSNLQLEGDFDGVGSLFEEENNSEDIVHGPFPLNHHGVGFDEIGLDDDIDLGKIVSDGRGDWLVSSEETQGEESGEVSMSLEGCLEIFTKTEVLSGENAWGCENCTKKYHEEREFTYIKPLVALGLKPQVTKTVTKSNTDCSDLVGKTGISVFKGESKFLETQDAANIVSKDGAAGNLVSCDGQEDREVNGDGVLCRKEVECANSEVIDLHASQAAGDSGTSSCDVVTGETSGSPSKANVQSSDETNDGSHGNGREAEACQEMQCDITESVDISTKCGLEHVNSTHVLKRSELDGEIELSDEVQISSDSQVANFGSTVEGDEVNNHKPEPEMTVEVEVEKKANLVNTRSSVKVSKLKRSKSRKAAVEPTKVIKQDATKRFLISRAPPVLTIQLKRFAQDMRGRLSKLSGHVTFQEWLDLHPFLDRRHVNFDCKYRLTGTVEHSGTLKSGHYVAFVRGPPALGTTGSKKDVDTSFGGPSTWYYISDSHVRQTNLEAVLQSEAYLVFYERVDTTDGV